MMFLRLIWKYENFQEIIKFYHYFIIYWCHFSLLVLIIELYTQNLS